MYCLVCGNLLPKDSDGPVCRWCKVEIAKKEIMENPHWALKWAFEALEQELKAIKKNLDEIKKPVER
jgi:hypothetical protein